MAPKKNSSKSNNIKAVFCLCAAGALIMIVPGCQHNQSSPQGAVAVQQERSVDDTGHISPQRQAEINAMEAADSKMKPESAPKHS